MANELPEEVKSWIGQVRYEEQTERNERPDLSCDGRVLDPFE